MNKQIGLLPLLAAAAAAHAQSPAPDDDNKPLQEVVVTGSRIIQTGVNAQSPISIINRDAIDKTGLASVGELLQQQVASGKALNGKFNSSGNFGYPADGGGIGAGSAQVDLRNLSSKRVLVLVDGIRWVNESSASGVSGAADLNTIPMSIIDRIEVLEDGASAIYGSDAIAGVVNIITRKNFEGVEVNAYHGEYQLGGPATDASITIGGGGEKFHGLFVASYFKQDGISSGDWEQSSFPEPKAGLAAGSSGLPQGRFTFCDPSRPAASVGFCGDPDLWYDVTLNNGALPTGWNPANPGSGNFHNFAGAADRFNFAPFNLLLTPSERKAMFASMEYEFNDSVTFYAKGLFNNRKSTNQAAPEPMFVGPFTGSGGLADTISVSHLNPYNPFGIDLNADSNLGWVTRRPLEVGPRIFTQDVDTWYANIGLKGEFGAGDRRFHWDFNAVTSDNSADQVFLNGYNIAKIALALGDPAVCAQVPNCVPLDLFGGQTRPFTPAMINWIRTTQIDQSSQKLTLLSANLTGTMFDIQDRSAGFAIGAEHRKYQGDFLPDPLRQTGESQDSFASPISSSYDVDELYAEFSFPLLASLDTSAAVRWSDYSTFGSETTGKLGVRWHPIDQLAFRGTYSKGFRAPNLGELYGLTQFAATLTDPCGPTGHVVVQSGDGPDSPLEAACRAQGVPNGFEQANTQITTFTGGNPNLNPEKSDSWTIGIVHDAAWSEAFAQRLTFELTYYKHEIDKGIQARDIQALINACLAAGGTDATLCSPFTRAASGNLNPPNNFLDNLGSIETDGIDLKVDWRGNEMSWGTLSAGLQATRVGKFTATDTDGIVSQRAVGIEVSDSAIPKIQANAQIGWDKADWAVSWSLRYIDSVDEYCGNAVVTAVPGCDAGETFNTLDSTVYNDVQASWNKAFGIDKFKLALGVNNVFGEDPPICYTCSLNGYDAGTYDLPGRFWTITARFGF